MTSVISVACFPILKNHRSLHILHHVFFSDPHRLNYHIVCAQCGLVTSFLLSCWYEASAHPHYNRLLSVIRMCLAWVYPISAPATSSVARLHRVSLADKKHEPCLHVEWKREDRRYGASVKFRDIYQRDESKLQRCTHVISQLDEKRVSDTKWSAFKKLSYTDNSKTRVSF